MSRMDKIGQMFKREIGHLLLMGEVNDPRVRSVTITYVDVSKDLSWAHVGFSVLSDDPKEAEEALAGLRSASGRIRFLLGQRVVVRYLPKLKFVFDSTIADRIRMSETFDELNSQAEARKTALGQDEEVQGQRAIDNEEEG